MFRWAICCVVQLVVFLQYIEVSLQQQDSPSSHVCQKVKDQAVEEDDLKMAYKASILSAIAYLEFEKDPDRHPWLVEFESRGHSTALFNIKHSLARRFCLSKYYFREALTSMKKLFRSIPLIGRFLRKESSSPVSHIGNHCSTSHAEKESIVFRWFFADWREGMWHDTEVLLGESSTSAVIIFRGSDSAADLFTNSQTMEPAAHSFYFGAMEGKLLYLIITTAYHIISMK